VKAYEGGGWVASIADIDLLEKKKKNPASAGELAMIPRFSSRHDTN
jgi:hypothetical protein